MASRRSPRAKAPPCSTSPVLFSIYGAAEPSGENDTRVLRVKHATILDRFDPPEQWLVIEGIRVTGKVVVGLHLHDKGRITYQSMFYNPCPEGRVWRGYDETSRTISWRDFENPTLWERLKDA